ncbi:hypothetical protein BDC45DRAFT_520769 [Circinella umbellata]|nr:hypothetical protein BDC45DRAFT_520769 [Circinella umbellata]
MPRNSFDYKQWVNQQSTRATRPGVLSYDYFDFARQLDSTEAITNMTFDRALDYAEKADKYHQKNILKARKNMSQSANQASQFGLDYENYWKGVSNRRVSKRKLEAAEKMTDIAASTMESIAEDIEDLARKRHHSLADSIALPSSSTDPPVIQSTTHTPTDLRTALIPLMKVVDQFDTSLKIFNIIDFTETGVYDLFKNSLDADLFEKLNLPVERDWVPDEYCASLLKSIAAADPDQKDLIVAVRTPVIEPVKFRPYKHRDLRALEIITGNWLDLLTSSINPIIGHHGEHTSAIYGLIPIINALFLQYNEKTDIEWIEIEADAAKRHKWDGSMTTSKKPKATIMMIKFTDGFAYEKETKNISDTQKVYRNALRVVNSNSPNACSPHPRIFTVLTIDNKIYFESLTQVDNEVYIRKRSTEVVLPASFSGFLKAVSILPSVFSWRNAVMDYVSKL